MKDSFQKFLRKRKEDFEYKTLTSSFISVAVGILFATFNGFLGIYYLSIWNGTICVYYILLFIVKWRIVLHLRNEKGSKKRIARLRKRVYRLTHILLFGFNFVLIVPIAVMIKGERNYNLGIIPAIAMAAYTTYRVVTECINYSHSRTSKNILIKELRTIGILDTMVSILILQNTLIVANEGGVVGGMRTLSIISSTSIWLGMLVVSTFSVKS